MPLPKPSLDNRSFDQLVAEGRGQIPRLSPQWTDHNASDPGITLVELAAWLTEQNIYRFDRPSDEARRAFARLVGHSTRARPASRAPWSRSRIRTASVQRFPRAYSSARRRWPCSRRPTRRRALLRVAGETDGDARAPGPAFGARPRPEDAFYLGFDRALDAPAQDAAVVCLDRGLAARRRDARGADRGGRGATS